MSQAPAWATLDIGELDAVLARANAVLDEPDHEKLRLTVEAFIELVRLLDDKRMSIKRLRQMLFGARTEKTRDVLADERDDTSSPPASNDPKDKQRPRKGHGRRPADNYTGAQTRTIPHPTLQPGCCCPHCDKGKVYPHSEPGLMIRIVGQAPLGATRYELDKLRCNLCGDLFTAPAPEEVGEDKYDHSAVTMIAMLKYGSGFPFNRLAGVQDNLGIPVPASTQWDLVKRAATELAPVHDELIRQAAQGELLHNDDTPMRVLELMDPNTRREAFEDLSPQRSGVFTSAIVSINLQRTIALFFTGAQHAGENLTDVLTQRAGELDPPLQMCNALSRNLSPEFKTIIANCLAHGRRKFVELVTHFPDQSRFVLETLAEVYKNDALTKKDALFPEQRMIFHQLHSGPLMNDLHAWMKTQIDDKVVEPNSGLGQAIAYMTNHWNKLTLFLHVPGAPLDNNICNAARGISNGMPTAGLCRISGRRGGFRTEITPLQGG